DHRPASLASQVDVETTSAPRADTAKPFEEPQQARDTLIAFGSSISGAEAYRRYAQPGVHLASEPDSEVFAFAAVEPVGRTYNLILDAAAACEDLEALVLVHPHTEIVDPEFCTKVREALRDPEVGAIGCAGANGVHSIAWWEAEVVCAPVRQRY